MSRGIQKLFADVPSTYELVNHILTLGLDIHWRRAAVALAPKGDVARFLDVCTGTGETAFYLGERLGESAQGVAADFSIPMLAHARLKRSRARLAFVAAEAARLPFPDGSFDLVTVSFATRNLNVTPDHLAASFREFVRVLRPGGRFINVETSRPKNAVVRRLFHLYIRAAVRPIGAAISGSRPAYAYLSRTIPRFYEAEELAAVLRAAGFPRVEVRRLLMGAAAIHCAWK